MKGDVRSFFQVSPFIFIKVLKMLCAIVIRATRTFGIAGDCTVVVREDAFGGRLADREKSWHGVGAGAGGKKRTFVPQWKPN